MYAQAYDANTRGNTEEISGEGGGVAHQVCNICDRNSAAAFKTKPEKLLILTLPHVHIRRPTTGVYQERLSILSGQLFEGYVL